MPAVQEVQLAVIERLHTHAYTIHRQRPKHRDIFVGKVVGVGFDGNLFALTDAEEAVQRAEYKFQIMVRQLRRRSASYINGLHVVASILATTHLHLAAQCTDVAVDVFAASRRVEVAVDATRLAERNMDVDSRHCFSVCGEQM